MPRSARSGRYNVLRRARRDRFRPATAGLRDRSASGPFPFDALAGAESFFARSSALRVRALGSTCDRDGGRFRTQAVSNGRPHGALANRLQVDDESMRIRGLHLDAVNWSVPSTIRGPPSSPQRAASPSTARSRTSHWTNGSPCCCSACEGHGQPTTCSIDRHLDGHRLGSADLGPGRPPFGARSLE